MMEKDRSEEIANYLSQYISDHKKAFIEKVLGGRTRHLTLVLEDIFQSQNASAVFRTAECFGVQDVHLIENINKYSFNKRVLKGANKWLNVIHHNQPNTDNTSGCFKELKRAGYKILAATPLATTSIFDVNLSDKIALVMGNELYGLSAYAQQHSDVQVKIPMHGFTESLNLSVSAAICVNEIVNRLRQSDVAWELREEEKAELRLMWYRKSVKKYDLIEKKFLQSIK